MNSLLALVFACGAVIGTRPEGVVEDSFIRDGVKIEDFQRLTDNAKKGVTHLDSSGSGFFITADGYLLTNNHVVDQAAELVVVKDGVAYKAELKAKNKEHDLALLKVNAFPRSTNGVMVVNGLPRFKPLQRALEKTCSVGQTALVIGYPEVQIQGTEAKVTKGIVSSLSGFSLGKEKVDYVFQVDATINHGNSGGPVVNEWGALIGVSAAGLTEFGIDNAYYAVKLDEVIKFLPKDVKLEPSVLRKRRSTVDVVADVIKSTVIILNYAKGSYGKIKESATDTERREDAAQLRKSVLYARMCKLRKEWGDLKAVTDSILERHGEVEDVKAMNDLARDELGLHLIIVAEADGHDVAAKIKPICGFKDDFVECEKPVALYGGVVKRRFPVEAKLSFEDDEWMWAGELKCEYDWRGTKEVRVQLKHIGKK